MKSQNPKVGIGIILENKKGEILIGKRKGSHAPFYSIPGGHLEMGESFEEAAIREIREETNLTIQNPHVIAVTNNLDTYKKEGVHYISIIMHTNSFSGELINNEPEKCDGFIWCDPRDLPQPHFEASEMGVKCFLEKKIFLQSQ